MKSLIALLAILTTLGWNTDNSNCKNSIYILDQVKQEYAADHDWNESVIKIHIQEPRIGNPQRFTKLWLHNSSDYFEMERNREDGIIKRIITENDESRFALNGESNISSEIKESHLKEYQTATETDLNLGGIHYSDAIVIGDEKTDKKTSAFIKKQRKKPVFENSTGEIKDYIGFYNSLLQD